jgi:signal transduction histidine kinase/putative methionine-R-sulfoxide reductase with GAF domain
MAMARKPKIEQDKIVRNIQKQYKDIFSDMDTPPAPLNLRQVEALKARIAELEAKLAQQPPAGLQTEERTRDLELASEVGRAISEKSSDIYGLISHAAELIRQRLNLSSAQIHLTDPAGRTLRLRAGTGGPGEEMLPRGDQLTLAAGSLSGRAASEKRALIVTDTKDSSSFLPDPLLPNTRSAMAIPLLAGGKLLGVLDMQSEKPGALNEANLPTFEALAGQLAVALENAALFTEAQEAHSEVEAQVRRLTQRGWQDFMDGIERGQKIGFALDQGKVVSLRAGALDLLPADSALSVPINVAGANVGTIQITDEPDRIWTPTEFEILSAAAARLAQHIEGLRLLAQTEHYRDQAEDAARRLTREGWDAIQTSGTVAPGYVYDLNQVKPLAQGDSGGRWASLTQPLIVRGETIGELGASVESNSEEAAEIISAVAAQVSIHIETLRLTEELQKRAAELQELDRLKTAFLANMSHELRTPLNSILGFTDVILEELDGPLSENMSGDLQLIQKNGQHLLSLINDVLDMAKIEAGTMNLNPERFRIHETISEVLSITAPQLGENPLSLSVEEDSDRELEIVADRTRIRQVMLNLVNNALKFTDQGRITIRAERLQNKALISIRDTGMGIPPNKLEAVFQEFAQVDSSTTRKAGGTGLGLPISRRLIEMHGGRLWAESTGIPGEGSTFYVELPIEARTGALVQKLTG